MQDTQAPLPARRSAFYIALGLIGGSLAALVTLPRLTASPPPAVEAGGASDSAAPSSSPTRSPATTLRPPPKLPGNAPAWVARHIEAGEIAVAYLPISKTAGIISVNRPMSMCPTSSFIVQSEAARKAFGGWATPHPSGRWYAAPTYQNCIVDGFALYDAELDTIKTVPAHGPFSIWLRDQHRFITFAKDGYWIYDVPSATFQRIWVPVEMREQLNSFEPDGDRPAWGIGQLVELPAGLAMHLQCWAKSCVDDTSVIGWYYLGASNGVDPARPVPKANWPTQPFCTA